MTSHNLANQLQREVFREDELAGVMREGAFRG